MFESSLGTAFRPSWYKLRIFMKARAMCGAIVRSGHFAVAFEDKVRLTWLVFGAQVFRRRVVSVSAMLRLKARTKMSIDFMPHSKYSVFAHFSCAVKAKTQTAKVITSWQKQNRFLFYAVVFLVSWPYHFDSFIVLSDLRYILLQKVTYGLSPYVCDR